MAAGSNAPSRSRASGSTGWGSISPASSTPCHVCRIMPNPYSPSKRRGATQPSTDGPSISKMSWTEGSRQSSLKAAQRVRAHLSHSSPLPDCMAFAMFWINSCFSSSSMARKSSDLSRNWQYSVSPLPASQSPQLTCQHSHAQ